MKFFPCNQKKSQAILEIGILGSIILLVTFQLVSYVQRSNDQQYLTMKTFRDSLDKAHFGSCVVIQDVSADPIVQSWPCSDPAPSGYKGPYSKGGSVTLNEIEHRRQASGDFSRKGQRTVFSSGSNIYWGVPFIDYEIGEEEIDVTVNNLGHYEIYNINDHQYSFVEYYDQDSDGYNDWVDDDIDGDGILNVDDDDANGDGIDDDFARDNSGMNDDLDSDGIPNWKDDDANGNGIDDKDESPRIEMIMNYQDRWKQTSQKSETSSSTINNYILASKDGSSYSEGVSINFYDRSNPVNKILGDGNDLPLAESNNQYLTFEDGKYKYSIDVKGVNRASKWSTNK